ncbi:hypothetical protein PYV02_01500 [Leifsonia sp. H3M29-4]|uniref:hypothetical protein n=1 Tax=Salinibacterium metalliresistens TaxID=3031321 RepID=UPI0023D98E33|nr:hypothetical protein [Salinibacterium metalliresistens]MDF1477754.1 hypothetical protein [Salinibacterium metalliresistens]
MTINKKLLATAMLAGVGAFSFAGCTADNGSGSHDDDYMNPTFTYETYAAGPAQSVKMELPEYIADGALVESFLVTALDIDGEMNGYSCAVLIDIDWAADGESRAREVDARSTFLKSVDRLSDEQAVAVRAIALDNYLDDSEVEGIAAPDGYEVLTERLSIADDGDSIVALHTCKSQPERAVTIGFTRLTESDGELKFKRIASADAAATASGSVYAGGRIDE